MNQQKKTWAWNRNDMWALFVMQNIFKAQEFFHDFADVTSRGSSVKMYLIVDRDCELSKVLYTQSYEFLLRIHRDRFRINDRPWIWSFHLYHRWFMTMRWTLNFAFVSRYRWNRDWLSLNFSNNNLEPSTTIFTSSIIFIICECFDGLYMCYG